MRERKRQRTFVSIATPGSFRWLLRLGTGFWSVQEKTRRHKGVFVSVRGGIWKRREAGYILTKGGFEEKWGMFKLYMSVLLFLLDT